MSVTFTFIQYVLCLGCVSPTFRKTRKAFVKLAQLVYSLLTRNFWKVVAIPGRDQSYVSTCYRFLLTKMVTAKKITEITQNNMKAWKLC